MPMPMFVTLTVGAKTDEAFCALSDEARAQVIAHVLRQCAPQDVRQAVRVAPDAMLGTAGVICTEAAGLDLRWEGV